jgi:hypothetical protein
MLAMLAFVSITITYPFVHKETEANPEAGSKYTAMPYYYIGESMRDERR